MAESHEYRQRFLVGNFIFLGILILILIVLYLIADLLSGGKIDLTEDRIYTISPATKEILSKLKDKVSVTFYSSEELPSVLQNLRRDTKDMFDEFYDLSGGNFQYTIVNPEDESLKWAEKKVNEYYEAKDRGETPKEPQAPQTIQDLFSGRGRKEDKDIREEREKMAARIAESQKRSKQEAERDLLHEAFRRNYALELEQRGIVSYPITERVASKVQQLRIYSSIEIRYLDKEPEVFPHGSIENLELEVATRVLKLTTREKPVVAFFDGRKPPMPQPNPMNPVQPPASDYEGIINYLNEFFDVRSINLKEGDSIDDLIVRLKKDLKSKATKGEAEPKESPEDKVVKPEDLQLLKTLIVAQPDQLEPRQVYEISRAVSLGVQTVFLVSPYSLDASQQGVKQGVPISLIFPGLDDVFRKWGIELGRELLASNDAGSMMLPMRLPNGMAMMVEAPRPVNVGASAGEGLDPMSALTNRIEKLVFPATTGLQLSKETLEKNGISWQVLAKTTPETWSVKIDPFANQGFMQRQPMGPRVFQYERDLLRPKNPDDFRDFIEPTELAVLFKGKFPFAFQGEAIPDWRKEEPKTDAKTGPPGMPPGMPSFDEEDRDLLLNAEDAQAAPGGSSGAAAPVSAPAPTSPAEAPASPPTSPASPPPTTPAAGAPAAPESPPPAPAAAGSPAPAAPPAVTGPAAPAEQPAAKPAEATAEAKPEAKAEAKPEAKAEAKAEEKAPEKPKAAVDAMPGTVLVLASVDMMKNDFLTMQSRDYQGNVQFFQNVLEVFGLGNRLIDIRKKQLTVRQFKKDSDKLSSWIVGFNMVGLPAAVGLIGIIYYVVRRRESVAYEWQFVQRK